jgi:chromosome transmission fidelity protein 1
MSQVPQEYKQGTVLLILLLGGKPGCSPIESSMKCVDTKLYTLADFMLSAEIDNINVYKLLEFCEKSRIAHKVGTVHCFWKCVTWHTFYTTVC